MAVKVQQVLEILEQIAPPELACSWDNVGLLVDAGRPVTSIMTALDITADVVRDAAESGCELIVSHHPVIFDPLRRVTAEDVPAMLLQNGISAICMHTNLDAAPGGVNDVLADLLRIENRRDFADNCGRIGTLNVPTTAQQLAETCSRMLHTHCKFVEADHPVEKLAEVSGAGGSYLQQAIDEGADCLVTGEAAHHIAILAKQKGVGLVVAGHWGTEHPVVFALADDTEVGFALYFHNFSTFLGRSGIYLEDLFVRPEYRGRGCGKALLCRLAAIAKEEGCGRLEWWCLDWNKPSIDFYKSMGAEPMEDWTVYRVTGETLDELAEEGTV